MNTFTFEQHRVFPSTFVQVHFKVTF